MLDLQTAINNVEQANTSLSNANTNQSAAQSKFDSALAAKQQADTDDANAVANFNSSLDDLIAAATAAKISSLAPPAPGQ